MSSITTHVLDTSAGKPAAGIPIRLDLMDAAGAWTALASGVTDADGRARGLLPAGHKLQTGRYRLNFGLDAYFQARKREAFFPEASLIFTVADPSVHYHVPLLISGCGLSSYRGS